LEIEGHRYAKPECGAATAGAITTTGGTAAVFRADATSIPDGEKLVGFAQKQFGRADTLVNNAGAYSYVPPVDLTEAQWDQMIDINMRGLTFQSQAFVRALRADDRSGTDPTQAPRRTRRHRQKSPCSWPATPPAT